MRRGLYLFYRFASSLRYWIGRRFTKAGLLALAGLVASGAMGLDTNRNLTYQVFSLLFFLFVIAIACGWWFHPRLTVTRRLPRFATAGEPLSYSIMVRNETARPLGDLLLREKEADPRPSLEEFIGARDPAGLSARWSRLVARRKVAVLEELALPPLPPRGEVEARPAIMPLRRGQVRLAGVTVARTDPFGLFKSLVTLPAEGSLLVLPKRYKVPDIRLPGTRKYQSGGVTLASSVADSEEFISLRDYRPGDPLRHIHWKSWAKAGKPIVKEYQDEFFVRHALILDTFLEAGSGEAFEEAVSVAASFACNIETQDSLLDLMFVENQVYTYTAGRGVGGVDRMLEVLASVRGCGDKPFAELRSAVLERQASLSGCICILLAWDQPRRDFLGDLKAAGIPVLALVVTGAEVPGLPNVHRLEVGKIAEGLARL
jgi:uncharacterized protein (DUF58 family)